ncbi:MAG: hypothetical protein KDE09_15740 [Anaerolineales bacterium]|nr:hypothetical protein [Anaerolineales bacterium]MCB8960740.1 hypothetical protein [Ardenticatenales bacterium]MCB0007687.1 hypothetical protein [Anaerolineales bacterium]MCB0015029.1 hypothetical protein [Anaerolineales bacterium]MCB0019242.1 hypothetical protein [Anaerolineales bacterium]
MYDPKLLKVIHEERIAPFTNRRQYENVDSESKIPGIGTLFARLGEKFAQLKANWGEPKQQTLQGKRASRPL